MLIRRCLLSVLSGTIALGPAPSFAQVLAPNIPASPVNQPVSLGPVTPSPSAPTPIAEPPITPEMAAQIAQDMPSAANVLPSDVPEVVWFNADRAPWTRLAQFGLFPADFSTPGLLFTSIAPGVDYAADLAPWLSGKMAMAVFAPGTDAKGKMVGRSVTLAPVADATAATKFLDRVKALRKKAPTVTEYQGVTILTWAPPAPPLKPPLKLKPGEVPDQTTQALPQDPTTALVPMNAAAPAPSLTEAQAWNPLAATPAAPKGSNQPPAPADPGFAIAYLPSGVVVSADRPESIQLLLDAQAGPKLSANPQFQRTVLDRRFRDALVVGFIDPQQIGAVIASTLAGLSGLPLGSEQLSRTLPKSAASPMRRIDAYLWSEPDGLHFQEAGYLKQALPATAFKANPNQLLAQLPEVNYMVASSQNLAALWKLVTLGMTATPQTQKALTQFRQGSQAATGLDDRDIFPWMDGEYLIASFPAKQGLIPELLKVEAGTAWLIQTSDRPAAEAALKKLDASASKLSGGGIKVVTQTVKGIPVVSWDIASPSAPRASKGAATPTPSPSALAHAWIDNQTLLLVTGADTAAAFLPQPWRTLPQSSNFQQAIAPLPKTNTGYFYLNTSAASALMFNSVLPMILGKDVVTSPAFDSYRAMAGNVRSVSATVGVEPDRIELNLFMALGLTRPQPGTLRPIFRVNPKP
jgi:Protein of unknown function (DUF3352)